MTVMDFPETPAEIFAALPQTLRPEQVRDLKATLQFELTGEGGGIWSVFINGGQCAVREGSTESPDFVVTMAADDYMAMFRGELNAASAFMAGRLKLQGNPVLAMQLANLFARPEAGPPTVT
jgi:putative sterol carrier protein